MPSKNDKRHTVIGGSHRAMSRYYMILNRLNAVGSKNKRYAGIEMRVSKDEFIKWFMERDFKGCSVDRIDNSGHYELSNMQVIPLHANIAKDKTLSDGKTTRCHRCGVRKDLAMFCQSTKRPTGVTTTCRDCERVRGRARYIPKERPWPAKRRAAYERSKQQGSSGI